MGLRIRTAQGKLAEIKAKHGVVVTHCRQSSFAWHERGEYLMQKFTRAVMGPKIIDCLHVYATLLRDRYAAPTFGTGAATNLLRDSAYEWYIVIG